MKRNVITATALIVWLAQGAAADVLELSQGQMRQLVTQDHVLSAETVVMGAAQNLDAVVIDIRGFLSEGRMTYRLLLQRRDGKVVEILVDGVSGARLAPNAEMGLVVSSMARKTSAATHSHPHARMMVSGTKGLGPFGTPGDVAKN